ncbi:MAG: hypothetical protein Q8891_06150 [Bacteroidota bacterium]|nr:hypothetical protein [Bacteroidota bacterium]
MNYSKKISPVISIGMDVFSGRNLNDFMIRFELTYSSLNYYGNKTGADNSMSPVKELTYSLKLNNITPSVSFLYNLLRKRNSYKVYAGVKLCYNLASCRVNKYVETTPSTNTTQTFNNYYPFEKGWLNGSASLGAIISNRFEVNVSYSVWGTFSNYSNLSLTPNILYGGVAYHFGQNND